MTNRTHRKNERGAALAVVGITMVLLVSMAAVGVDLGRLALTANEAQILADVGASSGARALLRRKSGESGLDPETMAVNTIVENPIDGAPASGANVKSFEYGVWDRDLRQFAAAGINDANAVRVTTEATVENVFAPVMSADYATSRVERVAIGAMDCPSGGRPVLPVTFGDCFFENFDPDEDCGPAFSGPPTATLAPTQVDTACWTSLSDSASVGAARVRSMLDPLCCSQCAGEEGPLLSTGDLINVQNGVDAAVLQAILGCEQAGLVEYTVPIVKCGSDGTLDCTGSGSREVVGFARVEISNVQFAGRADEKGIDMAFFCDDGDGTVSGGGGLCVGAEVPAIVQ
jgi:hypothetical protein